MIYTIPNAWNVTKYPDGDILIPGTIPKNEFLEIWVQQPMNFTGSLEEALQKSYDETVVQLQAAKMNEINGGNYTIQPAKQSFKGWEYIRCSGGIHMGGGDYPPEYGLDLFVIKLNDRFERIGVIKSRNNCNLSRYYPSDRLKYHNDIENFLFSVEFTDWKEPVLKTGTVKGDGITGVWQGIGLSVSLPGPGTSLGIELKAKWAMFFSNGQAYFSNNFPVEGLDEFNICVQPELNRRDWGMYTFNGDKGVLKLPYGDIPLRMENNKFILTANNTDHEFIKMKPVDDATFNGTYALSELNGKIPSITFTPAGTFTDNGALSILYHEYVDYINEALAIGYGTYEVKNYSVLFNYADGRKIKIAFPGRDYDAGDPAPATLTMSFNEDKMLRQ